MGSKSTLKKDTNEKENSIYKKKKQNEKEKKNVRWLTVLYEPCIHLKSFNVLIC
jgi:hypothetical protein